MATCNNCINDTPDSQNWESSPKQNPYQFKLDILPFGMFRITDPSGDSADCDLEELIAQLKYIRKQAREIFASVEFDQLMARARWHFPKNQRRFSGGTVVYFATASYASDQIKIGFTSMLRSRLTHLAWVDGVKHDVEVIAYAEHLSVRSFEEALHKKFAEYRVSGEWFKAAPVLAWLDTVKNGGAK